MFSNKKRIAELEAELARQDGTIQHAAMELKAQLVENHNLKNQVEYLVRTIRNMDEQIYKMSQCDSWNAMRPHFNDLSEGMISRKRAESDRISDLLRPELQRVYGAPKSTTRQIGGKK
jgi:uncharacterized coiled-coil protein SlyX